MQWNVVLLAERLYKCFVTIALLTTQMEITVCSLYSIAKTMQNQQ